MNYSGTTHLDNEWWIIIEWFWPLIIITVFCVDRHSASNQYQPSWKWDTMALYFKASIDQGYIKIVMVWLQMSHISHNKGLPENITTLVKHCNIPVEHWYIVVTGWKLCLFAGYLKALSLIDTITHIVCIETYLAFSQMYMLLMMDLLCRIYKQTPVLLVQTIRHGMSTNHDHESISMITVEF